MSTEENKGNEGGWDLWGTWDGWGTQPLQGCGVLGGLPRVGRLCRGLRRPTLGGYMQAFQAWDWGF